MGQNNKIPDARAIPSCLRVLSKFVNGYKNLSEILVYDEDTKRVLFFMEYLRNYNRPPLSVTTIDITEYYDVIITNHKGNNQTVLEDMTFEKYINHPEYDRCFPQEILSNDVINNIEAIKLSGLMTLLSVSTSLSDTDVLGTSGKNAGLVFLKSPSGTIYNALIVKIDPGEAFNYGDNDNLINKKSTTRNRRGDHDTQRNYISDLRDIQYGNNSGIIKWECLLQEQRNEFLESKLDHFSYGEDIFNYLFYRDGSFDVESDNTISMDSSKANILIENLVEYLRLENEIYQNDLQNYILNERNDYLLAQAIIENKKSNYNREVNYREKYLESQNTLPKSMTIQKSRKI